MTPFDVALLLLASVVLALLCTRALVLSERLTADESEGSGVPAATTVVVLERLSAELRRSSDEIHRQVIEIQTTTQGVVPKEERQATTQHFRSHQ